MRDRHSLRYARRTRGIDQVSQLLLAYVGVRILSALRVRLLLFDVNALDTIVNIE